MVYPRFLGDIFRYELCPSVAWGIHHFIVSYYFGHITYLHIICFRADVLDILPSCINISKQPSPDSWH